MSRQSVIHKILSRYYPKTSKLQVGEFANLRPAYVMTHDNTAAVMKKFRNGGFTKIHDPEQLVFAIDHDIQNTSQDNLRKYQEIEKFSEKHGIQFYPPGTGIGHQVMCERGHILPGTLVVASDSHSNMYGGLGCLGTPITRTDALSVWTTGKMWFRMPPVVRVNLSGQLAKHVTSKDLILHLINTYGEDVLNCAVEFGGNVEQLSIDDRLTIANMTTEWGAICGVFPTDHIICDWFIKKFGIWPSLLEADSDAAYEKEITCELESVSGTIVGPNGFDHVLDVRKDTKIKINKAYLLSCVNGRLSDFERAAEIMKDKKVASGVEFYLAAASREIEEQARSKGYWQVLEQTGAITLPSGCGPCIGLGQGILQDGEIGISATNRNFKGRMGSRNAQCYLASPDVVALSAISGYITGTASKIESDFTSIPQKTDKQITNSFKQENKKDATAAYSISTPNTLIDGFPREIVGNMVSIPEHNVNTDLIYAGKYTYKDLSQEEQARVVMENYDPEWSQKCPENAILFTGKNFGAGSSREQAATALLARGIRVVVAESFNYTFLRNAINNGLICIEAKLDYGFQEHRIYSQPALVMINFVESIIYIEYENFSTHVSFSPINETIQKLLQ